MKSIADIPNNYVCHVKLYKLVWGDLCCKECNHGRIRIKRNYEYCPHCRRKFSVKSETIFRCSKLSYQQIWFLIRCWQDCFSIGETKRITNLSYFTIRKWFKRLRQALPPDQSTQLATIVEVDESFFGKRRYGHQHCVIGAIERFRTGDKRRIKLTIIPDRERETLESFIEQNVRSGSHIATDCLWSYNELELLGYTHEFCNHSKYHFGPTNLIEGLWSNMKRHLRRVHGTLSFTAPELQAILKEYECRHNQPDLFYTVDNYLKVCACSAL